MFSSSSVNPFARQLVAVLAVVTVAITLAFAAYYANRLDGLQREADAELRTSAQLLAAELARWRAERIGNAEVLRRNRVALALLDAEIRNESGTSNAGVRHWLRSYVEVFDYDSALVLDAGAEPLFTLGQPHTISDETRSLVAQALVTTFPVLGSLQYGAAGDAYIDLVIPVPLNEESWAVHAIILRVVPGRQVFPMLDRLPGKRQSGSNLLFQDRRDHFVELTPSRAVASAQRASAIDNDFLSQMLAGEGARPSGLLSRKVYAAAARVPGTDWVVLSQLDRDEMLLETRAQIFAAAAASATLLLLAALAVQRIWVRQREVAERQLAAETAHRTALEAMRRELEEAMSMAQLGRWERDLASGELWWSQQTRTLLGVSADEPATHKGYIRRVHPDDRTQLTETLRNAYARGERCEFSYRVIRADGSVRYFHNHFRIDCDAAGQARRAIGTVQDVTEQQNIAFELHRQTAYLRAIVNHLPQGISVFDENLRLQYWNELFTEILELPPALVVREVSFDELIMVPARRGDYGPGDPAELVRQRRALAEQFSPHRFERTRPNGRSHLVIGEPLFLDGKIAGFITTYTDITERKQAEAVIEHLAHHDTLTGLDNRFSLGVRLEHAIVSAHQTQKRFGVVFLDLDRFKTINDSLGHHVGDALLKQVAERLRECVRETDVVARLGGDEFVVVLHDLHDRQDAAHAASKILARLSMPYSGGDSTLHTSPSIGISLYPEDGDTASALMRNADTAMYHAKARGRANYQFYAEELNRLALERIELERKLRRALDGREFELWYQPQYAAADGALTGVEALLRWRHPADGLIPPLRFIPVAEETGLIIDIGNWVLETACAQARAWQDAGLPALRMSINLSAMQLRTGQLVGRVADVLERSGLRPDLLELEITESAIMEKPQDAAELLTRLKALGVRIAIDDFGTGYSSLSYLKIFPLDHLKIDRSFVSDLETDANDAAIVAAAVSLAHNLGLAVIAEGVETARQVTLLRQLGCDELQGFHFSKPLPAAAFEELITAALRTAEAPA